MNKLHITPCPRHFAASARETLGERTKDLKKNQHREGEETMKEKEKDEKEKDEKEEEIIKEIKKEEVKCGIIMPISLLDGCSTDHWLEVKSIFEQSTSSIEKYLFKTNIVSEAEESGIIQKRIVQNLYNSDVVICDVSGKNPNVMFELGMRLAFDKPTIIVKDDKTDYSFDTNVIEHLEYPRDLRFSKIVDFKRKLSSKLIATYEESQKNPEYSSFLKSFGQFKIASLEEKEVSSETLIIESINDLRREMSVMRRNISSPRKNTRIHNEKYPIEALLSAKTLINEYINEVGSLAINNTSERNRLYRYMIEKMNPQQYFPEENEFGIFFDFVTERFVE